MSNNVGRSPMPNSGGPHPDYAVTALLLQGGGALGSYQAGVYEGLTQAGIQPNWVAGISIGALNCAVIAGNPPEQRVQRLREFWEFICRQPWWPPLPLALLPEAPAESLQAWRVLIDSLESTRALLEGQNGFFVPKPLAHARPRTPKPAGGELLRHAPAAGDAGALRRFRPHQSPGPDAPRSAAWAIGRSWRAPRSTTAAFNG